MWSDYINVKHQAPWGAYITDLDSEATLVQGGEPYAALLDSIGIIKVDGDEAASFLQGQITCDINLIDQNTALLGAHCNPKGRAQATFLCGKDGEDYFLFLPKDQLEATTQALSKFALFSKANISTCSDCLVLGFGNQTLPPDLPGLIHFNNIRLNNLGISLGMIPSTEAQACVTALQSQRSALVGDNAWQLNLIRAGIPHITASQSEQWIPQEFNYDLIDGVSFRKGCYKGQEIIARIHYRGQPKVRTFALEITGCSKVNIGDLIVTEEGKGTVLAAARVSECTLNVLSTLKIESSESENLKLEQNDDCQIRVLPLPYAIT